MLGKLWFTTVFCTSLLIRMGSSLNFGDLMHDVQGKDAGKVSFFEDTSVILSDYFSLNMKLVMSTMLIFYKN